MLTENQKAKNEYIGISEDRLHHILGVARKCYKIAKAEMRSEDFCRKMFMIGWMHDIGYEFSKVQEEHPHISSELLHQLVCGNTIYDTSGSTKTNHAIYYHGTYPNEDLQSNDEWRILNIADLSIDSKGNDVGVIARLSEIKARYGEHSNQYLTASDIAVRIGIIDRNTISRDQFGG